MVHCTCRAVCRCLKCCSRKRPPFFAARRRRNRRSTPWAATASRPLTSRPHAEAAAPRASCDFGCAGSAAPAARNRTLPNRCPHCSRAEPCPIGPKSLPGTRSTPLAAEQTVIRPCAEGARSTRTKHGAHETSSPAPRGPNGCFTPRRPQVPRILRLFAAGDNSSKHGINRTPTAPSTCKPADGRPYGRNGRATQAVSTSVGRPTPLAMPRPGFAEIDIHNGRSPATRPAHCTVESPEASALAATWGGSSSSSSVNRVR